MCVCVRTRSYVYSMIDKPSSYSTLQKYLKDIINR